jgi:hypothetical protein
MQLVVSVHQTDISTYISGGAQGGLSNPRSTEGAILCRSQAWAENKSEFSSSLFHPTIVGAT